MALRPSTRAAVTHTFSGVTGRSKSSYARLAGVTKPNAAPSFAWNGTILPRKLDFAPASSSSAPPRRVPSQHVEVPFPLSYAAAGCPASLKGPAEGEGNAAPPASPPAHGHAEVRKLKEIMSALKQSNFLRLHDMRLGSESGFSEAVSRHNIKELVQRLTWSGSLWELGTDDRALVEEARLLVER